MAKKYLKGKARIKATITYDQIPKSAFPVFKKDFQLLANKGTEEFGKAFTKEIKTVIKKQKYNWKPLNEEYLKKKIDEGYDHRIYIRTQDFLKSIGTYQIGKYLYIGPHPTGIHKPSGLPYLYLGRILEYGTERIPARPIWRPMTAKYFKMYREYQDRFTDSVRKTFKKNVKKYKTRLVQKVN